MLAIILFVVIPLVLFFYFKYNIGSIIVILFFLSIFYYTPYSFYLEPSYWQFRNMCKLNELPNDENKYNKILSYFDTDLESLDWEELNERAWKKKETDGWYKKDIFEYQTATGWKHKNSRIEMEIDLFSNASEVNRYNTNAMYFSVVWRTKRYYPDGNEGSGFYWSEGRLGCSDISEYNMNPKEANNAK